MRPSFIGNYIDFMDEDNASYPGDTELLSIGSAVGQRLGLIKFGIHIETLPPGRRTSYPHAESAEEEFAFVIEGNPDAWINGELHPLRPGDFIAFPAGTGITHAFINNSKDMVKLLVGGDKKLAENKIFYATSDARNLVMKTQERFWENVPKQSIGPHDGLSDSYRKGELQTWEVPTINTQRLVLRKIVETDIPALNKMCSNPNVARLVTWEAHKSIEETKAFYKFIEFSYINRVPRFGFALKENPDFVIGEATVFWSSKRDKIVELGVMLNEDYWGKGYMVEALESVIDYTWKNMDIVRIQARCKTENTQSFKMLSKLGMHYEGKILKSLFCKGKAWDMEMFGLTK
jgi:uncharacterized cupin superfamily protein/RimJ/RimL family protein N-acetyltransferase